MTSVPKVIVRVLVVATLALGLVAGLYPGRLELAARIYALVVAAAALWLVLAALRRAYPPTRPVVPLEARRGTATAQPLPPTLHRLEQACVLGAARSFDFHYRLRPRLREIAAGRLLARRGILMDTSSDAARRALGDETWGLLRADLPAPEDRLAPGVQAAELRRVVESLEAL